MAKKNGGFFDNPFGGFFDFNHDGKEDFFEQMLAFKMFEECSKEDDDTYDDTDFDFSSTSDSENNNTVDTSWRMYCEDGSEYGIDPEDYDDEDEYIDALEDAKDAWREACEDGSEYDLDPEDYETEDEYNEALEEARENEEGINITLQLSFGCSSDNDDETEELKESDFPNKRRYKAASVLTSKYIIYSNPECEKREKACCKFILDHADTIIAANYLDYENGFLYAQAVKDNFELPISLPNEDDSREYGFSQIICKIAKRDIPLSFKVWEWCLEQFLPYSQYDDSSASGMTNDVIDTLFDYPNGYKTELARYMDNNKAFMDKVMGASNELADDLGELIAAAIRDKLFQTSKTLFDDGLKKANGQWKKINNLTGRVILYCKTYKELESIEYFKENLFPIVKAIDIGMVQDEISEWEQDMDSYIRQVESECDQYAFSRRNAWRNSVPDDKKYNLNPRYYNSEQEYLDAINEAKYGWRKWYKDRDNYDLDPDTFETQEAFIQACILKRKDMQRRAREEQQKAEAISTTVLDDKTIYTYCGVVMPFSARPYFFRTDDTTIKIGDSVIVSIGEEQKEIKGTVVSIGQYSRIAVPYPVERTKFILRKENLQV